MSTADELHGSCSCGRFNHIIHFPSDPSARSEAHVHFGAGEHNRQSHSQLLSGWLRVPLTWYQSATVSFFPDELHEQIARTFIPVRQPSSQRKFCGYCGSHMSYWTEEPASERDFMNIFLGSLNKRDLLALEDLDVLPEDVDVEAVAQQDDAQEAKTSSISSERPASQVVTQTSSGLLRTSRSGVTGGISWFEDMMQGSQLGQHSTRRKGHGTSADGTTTISWEVSEYYDDNEDRSLPVSTSKRKAEDIAEDDTVMEGH